MKRRIFVFLLIVIVLFSFGCGTAKKAELAQNQSVREDTAKGAPLGPSSPNLNLNTADKKVIKNADVNVMVKNNMEAESKVQGLVVKYQGFIQKTESYKNKDNSYTNMEVRIPAERFEIFITEMKDLGELTHNRVYTTDVTEEYIDLSARQKTLLVQEERLQDMLKKAKDVDELLKVENEIARVRGEIERITGRLKYLDNKTGYSTINITLSTKFMPGDSGVDGFGDEVLYSLKAGSNTFLNLILFLIKAVVFALPFLVIILLAGYLYYKKGGKIFFRK